MAKIRLRVFGRIDLDGTHRAVVESDGDAIPPLDEDTEGPARFLSIEAIGRTCGCLLAESRKGGANTLHVDRFKLWHLGLRDGDEVQVQETPPTYASRISLRVPSDFGKRDEVRFIGKPVSRGEKTALYGFGGETRIVEITGTNPEGVVVVTPATEVATSSEKMNEVPVGWEDIGGLDREVTQIREVVEHPIRHPDLFRHLGISPPRGIILYGPPGTGKTLIARALASETGANFYYVSGPEVYSKWYGKSEENLRNVFSEAVKNAPSIVVVDELDALVPIREKTHGDQEQRIVATFLTQMDGLKEMRDVVAVGTTNRLDAIDPALRRGGRFEYEVHIGAPDGRGREQILGIHARRMPLADDVDLGKIAELTGGYVGADLASLCREAAFNAVRRTVTPEDLEEGRATPTDVIIRQVDFEMALRSVPPSAMKEFAVESPRVGWEHVGGLDEVKRVLVENIGLAQSRKEAFRRAGVRPAAGILLYGPPGTGKTLLARAVASECGANFISIKGPEVRSRWIGEAEERIRLLFAKARAVSPCVLFLDEIDAAVPARGRDPMGGTDPVVNQILAEMDGTGGEDDVFVVGATNRIGFLDPAVLRPGRFDLLIEVGLPDADGRRAIFDVHLADKPVAEGVALDVLAGRTEGWSGAEIAEACRRAAWSALRDARFDVERLRIDDVHIDEAIASVQESLRVSGGRS